MKQRLIAVTVALLIFVSLCACGDSQTESPPDTPSSVTSAQSSIEPPELSHQPGSYSEGFQLKISSERGTTVRYTLDGSEPTADSPEFPREGIFIDNRSDEPNLLSAMSVTMFTRMTESNHIPPKVTKATVLRAAAFSDDGAQSSTVTATYLVGLSYENIKIVSLVLDSDSLFDYENGIYVFGRTYDDWLASDPDAKSAETWELEGNFTQKGRVWEREVQVQVFDENGQFGTEQRMGLRIMGAGSRRYYQKSFRLTAREEYGDKHFEYPIITGLTKDFSDEPLEKYKSFVLRNGGNDNSYTLLRDPFVQSLLTDRSFSTQDAEPCIIFINGEYWGLYSITEDYSDNYIQYNYGVDNKNAIIIKNWELEEGTDEDMLLFTELQDFIASQDLSLSENQEWLWERIDRQSFIDYMSVVIYINNRDGIIEGNNWRIWRARDTNDINGFADGKWRFMLYDNDFAVGLYTRDGDYDDNTLERALESDNTWCLLFSKLMQTEPFRADFVNTFMDMRNTSFEKNRALSMLETIQSRYAPFMPEQYLRNGPGWIKSNAGVDAHFGESLEVIRSYMSGRYGYAPKMLLWTLELDEIVDVSLSVNDTAGGSVRINTAAPDLTGGTWTGRYFTDYPVTLTAEPAPGYTFAGWGGDAEGSTAQLTLTLTGDTAVTAEFLPQ